MTRLTRAALAACAIALAAAPAEAGLYDFALTDGHGLEYEVLSGTPDTAQARMGDAAAMEQLRPARR